MAKVRIDFDAQDDATKTIKGLRGEIDKLHTGLDKIDKQAGANRQLIGSWTELKSGIDLALGGVQAFARVAKQAYDQTVGQWSTYAEKIDKLTMSTGMGADEMSRLVQVADDFRVDMGQMETALKMALQNGFNPTTDALAQLADDIKLIHDPTEKANKLQEIFGRQWQSIIPMLDRGGAAIRAAADGIEDGLIVTEEAIAANREYQKSVDDLADSWMAFKYSIGRDVVPALNETLKLRAYSLQLQDRELSRSEVMAARERMRKNYEVEANQVTQERNRLLLKQYEAEQKLAGGMPDWTALQDKYAGAIQNANSGLLNAANSAEEMAAAADSLAEAQVNLAEAQANWKEGAAQDVVGLLDEQKLGAEGYEEALAIVDEVEGTNLLTKEQLSDAQEDLTQKLNDGVITMDEFKAGLQAITDQFMPLDESIKSSTALMDVLLLRMKDFERTWTATVRVVTEGGVPEVGGQNYDWEDYANRAVGGYVGKGTPYVVGEFGPELFVPNQTGQIIPNQTTNYILNAYHTQSAQAVERSFAIMRAWGSM